MKKKIAVICQEEKLWSLYAWNNVLRESEITSKFDFIGFWNCEEKFVNIKQKNAWEWYLSTFGIMNFIKLSLFALVFKIASFFKLLVKGYSSSFESLCKTNHIKYYKTISPNSLEFINWVKKSEIDILIIMVGHILKEEILKAPKVCTVNKHAGLLPSNKGVFPYFWAYLKSESQGISFHIVNKEIDEGALVFQEKVGDSKVINSMISFYFYCYKNYGKMLLKSLKNIENNTFVNFLPNVKPSYHGLPSIQDYTVFCKKKGNIIILSDLFLPFNL